MQVVFLFMYLDLVPSGSFLIKCITKIMKLLICTQLGVLTSKSYHSRYMVVQFEKERCLSVCHLPRPPSLLLFAEFAVCSSKFADNKGLEV